MAGEKKTNTVCGHLGRKHKARGMCANCYVLFRYHGGLSGAEKLRMPRSEPPTCHPKRKHCANGLCKVCYETERERRNPNSRALRRSRKKYPPIDMERAAALGITRDQAYNMKRKYGVTLDRYVRLFDVQGGKCWICRGDNIDGKALSVDHCHDTGAIRGLLCVACNSGIGLLGDNANRVLRAALYLNRFVPGRFNAGVDYASI